MRVKTTSTDSPEKKSYRGRVTRQFQPVTGTRPASEIMAQIRAQLANQQLKAGDRLPSERELAEQFAVSRNSLRQALRSLEEQGLLDIRKGASGGAFIHDGGGGAILAGLSDLYSLGTIAPGHLTEVRVLLGVEVVKLACERCTEEELEALKQNVMLAKAAASAGEFAKRTEINLEFHKMLARMTKNPILIALTDAVVLITQRFVQETGQTSNRSVMPMRQKLLRYLKERDSISAEKEMRRYLLELQKIYLKANPSRPPRAV